MGRSALHSVAFGLPAALWSWLTVSRRGWPGIRASASLAAVPFAASPSALPAVALRAFLVSAVAALPALAGSAARADEDMPTFHVIMKDGAIDPATLTVPAKRPFKLEISNEGASPAEFESTTLYKERVVAAGVTSSLVFRRLEPGEYEFFDDFHPGARAKLVVK